MKVLLVEDDPAVGQYFANALKANRYTVDLAADGQVGWALANQTTYDVILLDIGVPRIDGITLCRRLRQQGDMTPVVMLTAKDASQDVVTGLDAGADDYVVKPCEPTQLMARMRAVTRRLELGSTTPVLRWGDLVFDPTLIQVTYQQQIVPLSPKEYALLELFLRNPQRIFTRDAIIDHLWTIDDTPSTAAVTNLVKDLRRKLKRSGLAEELVETVHRIGYRLKPTPSLNPLPTPPPDSDPTAEGMRLLQAATQTFRDSLADRLQTLEQAGAQLRSNGADLTALAQLRKEAHRLAGGLGIFGYNQGSDLARQIEHLFTDPPIPATWTRSFDLLLTQLRQSLSLEPTMVPNPALPEVWGVGVPAVVMSDLQHAAAQQIRLVPQPATLADVSLTTPPQAILFYLAAEMLEELPLQQWIEAFPAVPVVVLANQDRLETRVAVARWGAVGYLAEPIPPYPVIDQLVSLMAVPSPMTDVVMILDDDAAALQKIAGLLQQQGFQPLLLQQPTQFWQMLQAHRPSLLLLDLEMPDFSGFDLCRVVRQDPVFQDLPILVVTAHTDSAALEQAFAAGADDFIAKDRLDQVLIRRVVARLQRVRRQQGQHSPTRTGKDNRESVLTRRDRLEEQLQQIWPQMSKRQTPLAVILGQIDRSEAVLPIDQAADLDNVLAVLPSLLMGQQDRIAAWGPDQIAILLPETSPEGALQVVRRIRQRLTDGRIPLFSDPEVSITLSFGVTGTVATAEGQPAAVFAIAQQALAAALARGGNTYCLHPL